MKELFNYRCDATIVNFKTTISMTECRLILLTNTIILKNDTLEITFLKPDILKYTSTVDDIKNYSRGVFRLKDKTLIEWEKLKEITIDKRKNK